jgi:xanthine dehydrogenase YagT iron-sulfur-binding subunit
MRRNKDGPTKKDPENSKGVSRRGFLSSVGAGAASVAAASQLSAESTAKANIVRVDEKVSVTLSINGRSYQQLVEPRWSLAYVIREELQITGTKVGCERGECGACTVLMDNVPRYSCMTLAVEAEGVEVTTIEGLMSGEELGDVQQAFVEQDAMQCGYCTSGQIMSVEGLLRANPNPTRDEARAQVSGNLCRCGAYPHIINAADRAAELKRNGGGGS